MEGFARVLDIGDTFTQYNTFADAREADFLALRSDRRAIGEDFDTVLAEYEEREDTYMATTLPPETETRPLTATERHNLEPTQLHKDYPVQGSAEWEQKLWSLGQRSHGVPFSLDATSREAIYEDAALGASLLTHPACCACPC